MGQIIGSMLAENWRVNSRMRPIAVSWLRFHKGLTWYIPSVRRSCRFREQLRQKVMCEQIYHPLRIQKVYAPIAPRGADRARGPHPDHFIDWTSQAKPSPCGYRGRRHDWTYQVRTAIPPLPPLEIPIRRAGAAFMRRQHIRVHSDAHAAPRVAPFQTRIEENLVEALRLSLGFDRHRTRHNKGFL